jgi:hypothetical protein
MTRSASQALYAFTRAAWPPPRETRNGLQLVLGSSDSSDMARILHAAPHARRVEIIELIDVPFRDTVVVPCDTLHD